MIRKLILLLTLLVSLTANSQIDSGNKSIAIPAEETNNPNAENEIQPETNNPIPNTGLIKPKENSLNGLTIPKSIQQETASTFSMFPDEEFGNPGELYQNKIKKHTRYTRLEAEKQYQGNTTNQFLGSFKTNTNNIHIVYRDHGAFDGDHVRIFINYDVIKPTVLLTPTYSGFKVKLAEGINRIVFLALDTGQVSPNTAEFQIIDDLGNIISQNQWNLAKGVEASIVIIKE